MKLKILVRHVAAAPKMNTSYGDHDIKDGCIEVDDTVGVDLLRNFPGTFEPDAVGTPLIGGPGQPMADAGYEVEKAREEAARIEAEDDAAEVASQTQPEATQEAQPASPPSQAVQPEIAAPKATQAVTAPAAKKAAAAKKNRR